MVIVSHSWNSQCVGQAPLDANKENISSPSNDFTVSCLDAEAAIYSLKTATFQEFHLENIKNSSTE